MYRVEFAVEVDAKTVEVLKKRFRICERIQNTMISEFRGRLLSFLQCKEFRILRDMPKSPERTKKFAELEKQYGLNQSSYDAFASKYQKHYNIHLDSHCVQKIGIRVKKAVDDYRFSSGKDIYFIKKDSLSTVENKDYLTGIRYNVHTRTVEWLGISMKLNVRLNDIYAETILREIEVDHINNVEPWLVEKTKVQSENNRQKKRGGGKMKLPQRPKSKLRFVAIKRLWVRNKFKYYVQLTVDGVPPIKVDKKTGEPKHKVAAGKKGSLDLGVSTVA